MLKLSEAIRLGAMIRPQGRGQYYSAISGKSCAIGAAAEACGLDITTDQVKESVIRAWPWVEQEVQRPAGVTLSIISVGKVIEMVPCLNDFADWTREQIADWIATIEPAETPSEQPAEIQAESVCR